MNLYNQLFKTYFYLAQMLFPKDSPRQREYLLVKTSLLGDKMQPYFEKVSGVKALAQCRSAKEVLDEAKHIQETEWPHMLQLANYFVVMGEDEKLACQVSLNKFKSGLSGRSTSITNHRASLAPTDYPGR